MGRDTIGRVSVNGHSTLALLDTGATINTIAPKYVLENDMKVGPMQDLVDTGLVGSTAMEGIAGLRTHAKGYVRFQLKVDGVSGYSEEMIAIVFSRQSPFEDRVPLLLGTGTIDRVIAVMKESEVDALATPWQRARVCSLMRVNRVQLASGKPDGGEPPPEEDSSTPSEPSAPDEEFAEDGIANRKVDPLMYEEVATLKRDCVLHPFTATVVMACVPTMFLKGRLHVTTTELREGDGKLPGGLKLQCTYTQLRVGSHNVSVVLHNPTAAPVRMKAGMPVARVESANMMPRGLLDPNLLCQLDEELGRTGDDVPKRFTEEERQEILMKRLDLQGLKYWPPHLAQKARELIRVYHDIFALDPHELGRALGTEHEIVVNDDTPFKERFRRVAPSMLDEVREHLRKMLDSGAIRPSNSPWCNAVVLVRKKDGGLRFCIDFRRLNDRTRKDSYPLPRIQESLDYLRGARHFSSMDFLSGFWQVPMKEESKKYTAFTVANLGLYECERMPFGLCNAPATFQRLMQNTLGEINFNYCLVYLDDVICFSDTEDEHLKRLRTIFERFRQTGLKLKPSKCKFFQQEIVYLAHHVSRKGVRPSRDNLKAIAETPAPANYTGIRSFVNLAGHYRRFIRNFSKKAKPLTDLLQGENAAKKKEKVVLPAEAVTAFENIKQELLTEPVLQLPKIGSPFRLTTDASGAGLGAELSQEGEDGKWHPVAYGSRSLTKHERNYHSSKLEFLALKWAITVQFRDYLEGAQFTVRTDNNPLTYVMTTPNLDATGHRWLAELARYTFKIEYLKGTSNRVADALSRQERRLPAEETQRILDALPDRDDEYRYVAEPEVKALLEGAALSTSDRAEAYHEQIEKEAQRLTADVEKRMHVRQARPARYVTTPSTDWAKAQREDPYIAACIKWLKEGKKDGQGETVTLRQALGDMAQTDNGRAYTRQQDAFTMRDDRLYVRHTPKGESTSMLLFVVPMSYQQRAIDGCHRHAGHQGQARTAALIRERFWWPSWAEKTKQALKGCERCLTFEGGNVIAPLKPIVATAPLDLVHVDFTTWERITPLNKKTTVLNVLVLTDHFTRYAAAFVTKDQKAETVARYLYDRFIAVFGAPSRLLSDQGANFLSKVIAELCKILGVQRCRTTPYHAQTNGQVERFHQTLTRMIGKLDQNQKLNWEDHLAEIVQAYNSTRSAVTGYSPFYLMFGRRPRLPVDFYFPTIRSQHDTKRLPRYVATLQEHLREAFDAAGDAQEEEAQRQKRLYDRRTGAATLKPGDTVLLRTDAFVGKRKLKDRWSDDKYVVVDQVADDSPVYRIQSEGGAIKTVHRNRLFLLMPEDLASQGEDQQAQPLCAGVRVVTHAPDTTHAVPHPSGSEMTRPQEQEVGTQSLAQPTEQAPREEDTLETESSWVEVGPPTGEGTNDSHSEYSAWACSIMPFAEQDGALIS